MKLKNGNNKEVIDWLLGEEIDHGMSVANYNVVYLYKEDKYDDKLFFFRIIIDVPF